MSDVDGGKQLKSGGTCGTDVFCNADPIAHFRGHRSLSLPIELQIPWRSLINCMICVHRQRVLKIIVGQSSFVPDVEGGHILTHHTIVCLSAWRLVHCPHDSVDKVFESTTNRIATQVVRGRKIINYGNTIGRHGLKERYLI